MLQMVQNTLDSAYIGIRWNVVLGYVGRIKFVHKVICSFPNGDIHVA